MRGTGSTNLFNNTSPDQARHLDEYVGSHDSCQLGQDFVLITPQVEVTDGVAEFGWVEVGVASVAELLA